MYQYDSFDQQIVRERAQQYEGQLNRHLQGTLAADDFRPLRLQNGLYIQRHAPMLRVAIPYGTLNSRQLRQLALIAQDYDKGYGHFTTRQNIQFNWPALEQTGKILHLLADVDMHAIQTSGNCIRNITADVLAGVAPNEVEDPRPYAEVLRQWSTLHPEFAYLPRKFKIAVSSGAHDGAAIAVHDVGLELVRNEQGEIGFKVLVGGGLGRTPILAPIVAPFIPWQEILNYLTAVLRVYNLHGRRDNAYKARIKILVKALGVEEFARQVQEQYVHLAGGPSTIPQHELERVKRSFTKKHTAALPADQVKTIEALSSNVGFKRWAQRNVLPHQHAGWHNVMISLKEFSRAPGDATGQEMLAIAQLADEYTQSEIRVSHSQNLLLPSVAQDDLVALHEKLKALGLAKANIGLASDIIACPGGDFCSLANAKSIPIAQHIQRDLHDRVQAQVDQLDYEQDLGDIAIKISGCMNSCGHHHIGHIGILGVDKDGSEWYQVSIGGHAGDLTGPARLGKIIGPSFSAAQVAGVVQQLLSTYLQLRNDDADRFVEVVHRVGIEPFKTAVYAPVDASVDAPASAAVAAH